MTVAPTTGSSTVRRWPSATICSWASQPSRLSTGPAGQSASDNCASHFLARAPVEHGEAIALAYPLSVVRENEPAGLAVDARVVEQIEDA